ncbi:copper-binding protein [Kibdelosporangium aridum]|uniref:Copper-binding protein n=1 Tax=Kibdelosporangium aridum TaxID=2030 RepID=A0A428ZQT1_KIBAR|nr:cupredoxin family copper-binding protein [Kibdelosporangium aridum]RSM90426.1 copper-binding protein [Kibdelosporangium aridum]
MSRIFVVLALFMLLPAPTAAAATQQVHMSGYAYGPGTLTINVGDTVTWTNHDQAPHDAVTTAGPAQFRSPMLNTGQTWSFTFTTPGTYSYYCSIHPDMRGQIVVRQAVQAPTPQQQQQPAQSQRRQTATSAPRTQQTSAVVVPETVEETPVAQQPVVAATPAPPPSPSLDPLLLVAGLVAGVATLCLLLIGSRSAG